MPAAIPAIIVSGISYGAGILTFEAFVASVVLTGLSTVVAEDMLPDSQLTDAQRHGNRLNTTNNVEPIPVVYGRIDHASGAVAWRVSHSLCPTRGPRNNECLTTIIVWSEGEIGSVNWLYFNDIESTDERFVHGNGFGGCINAQDTRRVWLAHYLGTDDQAADAITVTVAAENSSLNDKWTADHRLRGIAYSRVLLRFEDGLYGPNAIPVITANLEGKKCYDWRTGTSATTSNPALILYDYLTNTRYGCAFRTSEIDLPSFSEAANYCEQYVVALGLDGARRRYDCNGALSPAESRLDNVKKILAACRGFLVYSSGVYKLKIDKPEVAAFDLNETNITGQWSISLDSYGKRFNRVTARFINSVKESQPDLAVVDSPAYRAADQDELLEAEMDLPLVTSRAQALDIAGMALRQSRYSVEVEVNCLLTALRCEVGDVVTLTHEVPGWSGKLFRVQRIDLQNNDEVRVQLLEYNADVYDITSTNEDEQPPGTTLPDPRDVDPVTGFTLSPGSGDGLGAYIDASWLPSESTGVIGYDIEWGQDSIAPGGVGWSSSRIGRPDAYSFRITGLLPTTLYRVRVRARNSIGSASSWVEDTRTSLAAGRVQPIVSVTAQNTSGATATLTWVVPGDQRIAYVEIWRSVSTNFFDGTDPPFLAAMVPAWPSTYPIGHDDARYYWVRALTTNLVPSAYTPSEYGAGITITG